MIKFKYQYVVEQYSSFYVLGVGRKTGVTTRVDALHATASKLNKPISVQSGSVMASSDSIPFVLPDVELIIVLTDQYFYPEKLLKTLRGRNHLIVDTRIDSVFTEEYEQALEAAQIRMMELLASQDPTIAAVVHASALPELPESYDQLEALEDA